MHNLIVNSRSNGSDSPYRRGMTPRCVLLVASGGCDDWARPLSKAVSSTYLSTRPTTWRMRAHLIHGSLSSRESTSQAASLSVHPFCRTRGRDNRQRQTAVGCNNGAVMPLLRVDWYFCCIYSAVETPAAILRSGTPKIKCSFSSFNTRCTLDLQNSVLQTTSRSVHPFSRGTPV